MITIYLIAFNEEKLLPYTVAFYRKRFQDCRIVVYDNFSTDNTVVIALRLNCEVQYFYTRGELSDQAFVNVKNECWKTATTPWVIVCDCDEWLDIWPVDLIIAQTAGDTILRTSCTQMIGFGRYFNPATVIHGYTYPEDYKFICFNREAIQAIHYDYGCHTALPWGGVSISDRRYPIYHYKWITLQYVIDRHRSFGKRLSAQNRKLKLSFHYLFSERKIRREYEFLCKKAVKIF